MLNKFRKSYINSKTGENTDRAGVAMDWHRHGDTVQVNTYFDMPHKTGLHNVVHIPGVKKKDENREHCKRIALELEEYANGTVYRCPECGEVFTMPVASVGDKFKCASCGNVAEVDEYEQQSLYDYFSDCLDIEYRIGSDKQFRSVQIMIAWGGPNIYIDTASCQVELYWWGDRASYPIDRDICGEIDSVFEEILNC